MAKSLLTYKCSACGAAYNKWAGRCENCGQWNSITDDTPLSSGPSGSTLGTQKGRKISLGDLATHDDPIIRNQSGISEFDHVLGGGLVPASVILVGGDPGIGKSTLLLQVAAHFAKNNQKAIYISGEEASSQIRLRAQRLGLADAPVKLTTETNLRDILTTIESENPDLAIIDSIQTMWVDHISSAPGSVSQVRATAHELTTFAKRNGISIILVGHVTKEGQIAGPRIIEHMVDTVLYFEGERGHQYRILRTVKNRFGSIDEIGVFEMTGTGLAQVKNSSELFLSERDEKTTGSVVFAGIEGTRPLLIEIQALVAPSALATPRRAVVGWDAGRLSMILAILEARCGISFSGQDVYLNIAGGLRISEPAADLAIASALVSAYKGIPVAQNTVIFGELSLSGALRPIAQIENRLREAQKLGFDVAITPARIKISKNSGLKLKKYSDINTFILDYFSKST